MPANAIRQFLLVLASAVSSHAQSSGIRTVTSAIRALERFWKASRRCETQRGSHIRSSSCRDKMIRQFR
jgi:hypothetical protein